MKIDESASTKILDAIEPMSDERLQEIEDHAFWTDNPTVGYAKMLTDSADEIRRLRAEVEQWKNNFERAESWRVEIAKKLKEKEAEVERLKDRWDQFDPYADADEISHLKDKLKAHEEAMRDALFALRDTKKKSVGIFVAKKILRARLEEK